MTFEQALKALGAGRNVSRADWNGEWIQVVLGELDGHPYIRMYIDGKFVPWLPSHLDLFAEDWQIHKGYFVND